MRYLGRYGLAPLAREVQEALLTLGHLPEAWTKDDRSSAATFCRLCGWAAVIETYPQRNVEGTAPFINCPGRRLAVGPVWAPAVRMSA